MVTAMGNRNPEVDTWLQQYDNPHRELLGQIREFILSVDPRLSEAIKWQAPTSIADELGLLEGDGEVSRVARFVENADFEAKKPALEAVILGWIKDKG